jgi:(p)ppGpp synthase/HD superfamily hydrolase
MADHQPSTAFGVDDAVAIARRAHDGQLDKAGRPYIGHPLRVMAGVRGEHAQMAAVLHDVVEDTAITAQDLLASGCPPPVVSAVVALSKVPGEPQADYLRRVAADPLALTVKRADIADNADPERLALLDPATRDRLTAKYAQARRLLDRYEREFLASNGETQR